MMSEFFDGSPFGLTADPATARIWAGRPKTLSRLSRLSRSILNAPESSLDILWANFGAGKTHALLHLQHLLQAEQEKVVFGYVEVPEQTRRFFELYQRILASWDTQQVARIVIAAGSEDPDLLRACQVLLHGGSTERDIAKTWLLGGKIGLAQLKSLTGISSRIDDDIKATDKLTSIISCFASQGYQTVICLDEFQRLSLHNPREGLRVMQSLRTVLSHCSNHLSVVLAIASRAEQTAIDQLPQELKTLLGNKPAIALPALSEDEALTFIVERMAAFRSPNYEGGEYEPFGQENVKSIVTRAVAINDGQVGPRQILLAAGWVLNQLGVVECSDEELVEEVLNELKPER